MTSNLFGWSDQTWQTLDQLGIFFGDMMLIITIGGLLYGIYKRNDIRRWFTRNRFPSIGGSSEQSWQGLIFTVSNKEAPCWVIGKIQPAIIGLLTTDFSRQAGDHIQTHAEQRCLAVIRLHIDNPDDPAEVKQRAQELVHLMQKRDISSIAVDITGGKAPMSVGAFMAAEESGCDSIYVTTKMKEGKPDQSTARIIPISQAGSQ